MFLKSGIIRSLTGEGKRFAVSGLVSRTRRTQLVLLIQIVV